MKKQSVILLTLLILGISSCQKEPSACFSTISSTAEVGQVISFTNCSKDADGYRWDFGDNSGKVNGSTLSHAYTTAGTYVVIMEAFSKNGKKEDKVTKAITVNDINKKFVGTYNMSGTCVNNMSYLMQVSAFGTDGIKLANWADNSAGWILNATVSGSNFSIASQVFYDSDGTYTVTGNGYLIGNSIIFNMAYSYVDYVNASYNENANCTDTGTK